MRDAPRAIAGEIDPDVRLLRGIADPSRLAIVHRLSCEGSVAACDFRDCCATGQPTLSHHLKVLRDAGWVRIERRGTHRYYTLDPAAVTRLRHLASKVGTPFGLAEQDDRARLSGLLGAGPSHD